MRLHQDAPHVQQSAIAAIWCLVNDHPENQASACSMGVVELISSAVQRFGAQPEGRELKPTAAGALQVLVPGFSSALSAASSVYTAGALGLPLSGRGSPISARGPLSGRASALSKVDNWATPIATTRADAAVAAFSWPRPSNT